MNKRKHGGENSAAARKEPKVCETERTVKLASWECRG